MGLAAAFRSAGARPGVSGPASYAGGPTALVVEHGPALAGSVTAITTRSSAADVILWFQELFTRCCDLAAAWRPQAAAAAAAAAGRTGD